MNAREELDLLLSEPVASARSRAASAFDEIAGDRPVVLFGAGGLGRRMARGLQALQRPAVAFADNNPKLAGTTVEGLPVFATADAIARYADAVFVVAVWRAPASERMSERIERLRALGAKRVTSFATLSWKYPQRFLPYYAIDLPEKVLAARDEVVKGFELLSDEPSRRELVAHLRLRLLLDFDRISEPAREPEYFPPDLVTLSNEERFVDAGAFDGDTVRSFLGLLPDFRGRVDAFEPDAGTFERLGRWQASLPQALRDRVAIHRAGVGARRERVSFGEGGGTGSAVGAGATEVDIVPLDEVVDRPTLIKVDTEGYEPEVLHGARKTISSLRPKLALCVYHRQDHPWRIPLMVRELYAGYRFTLRSYCLDGWDLVLYGIP